MEVVEIPTTFPFEEMLKKLGLPIPVYKTRMSGEATLVASVMFYPATRCLGFVYGTISLADNPMDTLEAANNDTTKRAIKYMEKTEQKILKDYSFDQLNEERLDGEDHIDQIIKNNRKNSILIKEKDHTIKEITKHWDNFIEVVSTANNKVYLIAEEGYTVGTSEI